MIAVSQKIHKGLDQRSRKHPTILQKKNTTPGAGAGVWDLHLFWTTRYGTTAWGWWLLLSRTVDFDPCRLLKNHRHVSTPHVAIPKSRHGSAWCPSTSGTINQLFVAHIPTSLSSGAVWTLRDGYFFSTPGTDIIHEGTPISEDPGYTCQTCRSVFGSTWAGNDPIPIFIPHRFRIFCWELFDESHPLWDSWNIEHHCVVFLIFYLKSTTESCTVMSFGL